MTSRRFPRASVAGNHNCFQLSRRWQSLPLLVATFNWPTPSSSSSSSSSRFLAGSEERVDFCRSGEKDRPSDRRIVLQKRQLASVGPPASEKLRGKNNGGTEASATKKTRLCFVRSAAARSRPVQSSLAGDRQYTFLSPAQYVRRITMYKRSAAIAGIIGICGNAAAIAAWIIGISWVFDTALSSPIHHPLLSLASLSRPPPARPPAGRRGEPDQFVARDNAGAINYPLPRVEW